jgi:hypothetical protein
MTGSRLIGCPRIGSYIHVEFDRWGKGRGEELVSAGQGCSRYSFAERRRWKEKKIVETKIKIQTRRKQ